MNRHSATTFNPNSPERRALSEQQVLLFWLLSKILRRLARSIPWTEVSPGDKRRLSGTLALLENDVCLVRLATAPAVTHRN
jgi:hypothetical protein